MPTNCCPAYPSTGASFVVDVKHLQHPRMVTRSGGPAPSSHHLVFETRDPSRRVWQNWNRAASHRTTEIPGIGTVESWVDLTHIAGPLVTFRSTFVFSSDGAVMTSDSTLRFRTREEAEADLATHGFVVEDVRSALEGPESELVFVSRRSG